MVGDLIICLLAFFDIFISFYFFFFNLKKEGSRREGPRFVYTRLGQLYDCVG